MDFCMNIYTTITGRIIKEWASLVLPNITLLTAGDYMVGVDIFKIIISYDQIKKGACIPVDKKTSNTNETTLCPRSDTGLFGRGGVSWIINPANFLSFYVDYQSLENPDFLIYDKTALKFTLQYSRAFPNVKSSTKFKRRFYETSTANEVF